MKVTLQLFPNNKKMNKFEICVLTEMLTEGVKYVSVEVIDNITGKSDVYYWSSEWGIFEPENGIYNYDLNIENSVKHALIDFEMDNLDIFSKHKMSTPE